RPVEVHGALLHTVGVEANARPVQIIDLSFYGAKLRTDRDHAPGSRAVLALPNHSLRLEGTIVRIRGTEVAMVFDPRSSVDPVLERLLRSQSMAIPADGKRAT
ncbi:MAG: PilZ domain-containing protein, partial [Rhodopila sp.]|nr:PilZ domain-containing protein [Rhodopila sp.]